MIERLTRWLKQMLNTPLGVCFNCGVYCSPDRNECDECVVDRQW